jgi:hypothetical protein
MIHLGPSLALNSTTIWITTIPLILVIAVHCYLRRLIRKQSHANQLPA